MNASRPLATFCRRTRREFLWEAGAGFTGVALTALLSQDGFFAAEEAVTIIREAHNGNGLSV